MILRRRARAVAQTLEEQATRDVFVEVGLVRIGLEVIGLPSSHLFEIMALPPITRLPAAPEWLAGVVNVRGELMSAVDLARLYSLRGQLEAAYLTVVGDRRGCLGLLTDEVLGFQEVRTDELAPHLADLGNVDLPVLGITRDLVLIIDTERLLEDERLIVE